MGCVFYYMNDDLENNSSTEASIRPYMMRDFIGQDELKSNLHIFIEAAKKRKEPLDHTIFYGPPGLGKTTLAQIIAFEMGVSFKSTSGPILSKAADLAAILTNLKENDVLFIDEMHRLSITLEEVLYSAMEDFRIDIIIGEGPMARTVKINLPKFTLIGATTRLGLISNPMHDRFGIPMRLSFYRPHDLSKIIIRGSNILNTSIDQDAAIEIAKRSRGTPRIAIRLFKRLRDFAEYNGRNRITLEEARSALNRLRIDQFGLDSNDVRYMNFILSHYGGGPVGVETIAAGISEKKDTIEDIIEPYLIQIGFIHKTPRGRILTEAGLSHYNTYHTCETIAGQ